MFVNLAGFKLKSIAFSAMGILLALNAGATAAKKQTFTGEVGDAMCGRKHMEGTAAECTRSCVGHGSKFALVVGEKIYVLDTSDSAALSTLDQQAGKTVNVTGTLEDESTIRVVSVRPK